MSFSIWFKRWINAFFNLLLFSNNRRKSDAQRKREQRKRLISMYSASNLYRTKKKRKKRRSSQEVQNDRLISAMLGFLGASLGILLLPLGLLDWGIKNAKSKRGLTKSNVSKKASHKIKPKNSKNGKSETRAPIKKAHHTGVSTTNRGNGAASSRLFEYREVNAASTSVAQNASHTDESIPKSTPKHENDRYIRKRMIIAGSYYCEKNVLDTLEVGACIDLEAEPDNPHDKNAIKLLFNNQKIGYIAKKDQPAFITCLRLKRRIYGIITDIIVEDGTTKYEYETWFDER